MLLALSWATLMHTPGWAQTSHFAQTRAIAAGERTIDRWQWETMDKGWIDGHFYSVKAPGVALLSAPLYAALKAVGAKELATDVAHNAAQTASPNWTPRQDRPWESYGYSRVRAQHVERHVERETPLIWALALLTSAIPGLILLLLVRWVGDRFVPGYGTAAALTLGAGTIVMSFASIYASHVLSACLLFGAFAVLLRERDEERARPPWLLGAGLLAGFAVTTEYPLAIGGAILFAYALFGAGRRLPRGAAYAAGAVAGALPALAFNDWTLGSPTDFAYSAAVAIQGFNGHAVLGLNSGGFFGIGVPNLHARLVLLVGSRSLLALTPVLGAAVAGLAVMWRRRERRAEWAVIVAMAVAYLLYNTRLLAAARRRHAGTPLSDADAALPRGWPRLRVPAPARDDDRARDPLRDADDRRRDHLPATRRTGHRTVGRDVVRRQLRAHPADRGRSHRIAARDPARARAARRRRLDNRACLARTRARTQRSALG